MNSESKRSSEPQKQIKNYEFCRRIIAKDKELNDISNNISVKETPKSDNSQIILSFNVILYERRNIF